MFDAVVWSACALVCDGVWCLCVRLCVFLCAVCAVCFVVFEYDCVFVWNVLCDDVWFVIVVVFVCFVQCVCVWCLWDIV